MHERLVVFLRTYSKITNCFALFRTTVPLQTETAFIGSALVDVRNTAASLMDQNYAAYA